MRLHAVLFASTILAASLIPVTAQPGVVAQPASSVQPCGFAYSSVCGGIMPHTLNHDLMRANILPAVQQHSGSPQIPITPPSTSFQTETPRDSRTQLPAFAPKSAQPSVHPQLIAKSKPGVVVLGKPATPTNIARNQICYAIRAYNFPTDPAADITKPANITTCEPAKDATLKSTAAPAARLVY